MSKEKKWDIFLRCIIVLPCILSIIYSLSGKIVLMYASMVILGFVVIFYMIDSYRKWKKQSQAKNIFNVVCILCAIAAYAYLIIKLPNMPH